MRLDLIPLKNTRNNHQILNRGDFLRLCLLAGGAAFLSACQKALSMPTTTPTLTSIPTDTSTPSPNSTATNTQTPPATITPTQTQIATITPSKTPTPMATKAPTIQWISPAGLDIKSGDYSLLPGAKWSDHINNGKVIGKNSNHPDLGPCIEYQIINPGSKGNDYRHYPYKFIKHMKGEWDWEMEIPCIIGEGILDGPISLLNTFVKKEQIDRVPDRGLAELEVSGSGYFRISVKNPDTGDEEYQITSPTQAKVNTRYDLLMGTNNGKIFIKVNGEMLSFNRENYLVLPLKHTKIAPVAFRSGAHGRGAKIGSKMWNGPLTLRFFQL